MEGSDLFKDAYKEGIKQNKLYDLICCNKNKDIDDHHKNKFIGGKWPYPT
jgi:hypothetical protein